VAAPAIKKEIQRDREVEEMHRGKQYQRAIKNYYKKFNAYPPNVDALVKTNEIRFLRRKYVDLTTGKDEWKIIRFGQAKTQTLGFFGQPIAGAGSAGGSMLAGTGPTGGNSGIGGSSGIGGIGSGSSSGFGPTTGTTDPGTNPATPTGTTGSSTDTTGGTDANGNPTSGTGTTTGLTGQSFGGGGIIGFSPTSPKQSILIYKKKNHYNEWEFVYDPLVEQMQQQGGNTGMVGQPASSTTTPVGTSGIDSGPGSGSTGSGFGNTGSSFGSGFGTTPQPQPSQPQ